MPFESADGNILSFAKKLADKDDEDHPKYFFHFSNVLKLEVNPAVEYDFCAPIGVYGFPVHLYEKINEERRFKIFANCRFAFFLKISENAHTIYLSDKAPREISEKWIEKLKSAETANINEKKLYDTIARELEKNSLHNYASIYNTIKRTVKNYSGELAKDKSIILWKIFSKLFYIDVIVDNDGYELTPDFRYQVVFLPPFYGYEIIEMFERPIERRKDLKR